MSDLPSARERTWQPNLIVPVESPYELRGSFRFLYSIARPKGSIKILGLSTGGKKAQLDERLHVLTSTFRRQGVFATWAVMEAAKFGQGVVGGMQALRGAFLRPNTLFLTRPRDGGRQEDLRQIISKARENRLGVLLFASHPAAGLGLEKSINLWINDRSPDWQMHMHLGNLDLCLLTAYLLERNWNARLNLVIAVRDPAQEANARDFLGRLAELTRIPKSAGLIVRPGEFIANVASAPQADLNIFGLPVDLNFDFLRQLVEDTRASCVLLLGSGEESALA